MRLGPADPSPSILLNFVRFLQGNFKRYFLCEAGLDLSSVGFELSFFQSPGNFAFFFSPENSA